MQDPASITTFHSLDIFLFSRFTLNASEDPVLGAHGRGGFGITLSRQAEGSLLNGIPINCWLCA